MRSASSWRRGRGGERARRRWRSASRIVLAAAEGAEEHRDRPAARRARSRRRASGATGSPSIGWTGCSTSRGRGSPRTITDAQVEEVIIKTLETHAEGRDALVDAVDGRRGRARRSRRCMRIWRAFGLQPHRQETWKLVQGPAVHRQGPRRRRALSQPARARGRAVRR